MIAKLALVFLLFSSVAWAQREDDVFVGQKAPEIKGDRVWINTPPLTLESLKGKVVVVDFWAFDCPFCAEAMPHVMDLQKKYAKDGLVIIGVHTPRVDYEKDVTKIKEAVTKKGIVYPVVVDNNYGIWGDYFRGQLVARIHAFSSRASSSSCWVSSLSPPPALSGPCVPVRSAGFCRYSRTEYAGLASLRRGCRSRPLQGGASPLRSRQPQR